MVRKQKLTGHHYRRPSNKRTNVLFVCCLFFSSHLQRCRGDGDAKCRVCDNICQCLGKSANHNDGHEAFWLVRTDHVTWTLASDWLLKLRHHRVFMAPTVRNMPGIPRQAASEYWPLIGQCKSRDLNTCLWLAVEKYARNPPPSCLCSRYALSDKLRHIWKYSAY